MTGQPVPAFQLREVRYAYRDAVALDGLSLRIEAGERLALLGANGSGKSTLLRVLDGLYFAAGGSVEAFGKGLDAARFEADEQALAFRRRVGLVFQNPDIQLFNPTVFDEIAFGPLQLGWPREMILRRVERAMEDFAIAGLRARAPHRLSGGERKRVALASVLVLEPDVLLLDEPTAALDPSSAEEVIALLAAGRHTGRTVVTATHDLDIVPRIADRCVVLQAGRVVADGPPAAIFADTGLLARSGLAPARHRMRRDPS